MSAALEAASVNDWQRAVKLYRAALDQTPTTQLAIRGGLLHDLAILSEKADDRARALEFGQQSIDAFSGG